MSQTKQIQLFAFLPILFVFLLAMSLMISCKEQPKDKDMIINNPISIDTSLVEVDKMEYNQGRTVWQKPDLVIEKMGNIQDKVIADVGAGTGYFVFRLALKAKKVLAIDIDTSALRMIEQYIPKLPIQYAGRVETRLSKPKNPMLADEEVDIAIIINTISYIPELDTYLQMLKKGIKKGGNIMIVDYKMRRLPIHAPPKSERMYLDDLEDVLEKNGFILIQSDDTTLDYQYIIMATNP
ncbi:MAG: methyltransferase domain-containing protein [Saprospiraceae bacterium]